MSSDPGLLAFDVLRFRSWIFCILPFLGDLYGYSKEGRLGYALINRQLEIDWDMFITSGKNPEAKHVVFMLRHASSYSIQLRQPSVLQTPQQ